MKILIILPGNPPGPLYPLGGITLIFLLACFLLLSLLIVTAQALLTKSSHIIKKGNFIRKLKPKIELVHTISIVVLRISAYVASVAYVTSL